MTLSALPTLDELAARPERMRELSEETAFELHLKAQAVLSLCALRLAKGRATPTLADALSTDEAARLLGVSASTLRHGARTTYRGLRIENGTRRLAWARDGIERFMKRR
jgi:hypothetical protein